MIIKGKSCGCSCSSTTFIDSAYIFRQKTTSTTLGTNVAVDFNGGFNNGSITIDLTSQAGVVINSSGIYEITYYTINGDSDVLRFLQLYDTNNGSVIPASTYGHVNPSIFVATPEIGVYGQTIVTINQASIPSKIILRNPSTTVSFPIPGRAAVSGEIPITASLIIKKLG